MRLTPTITLTDTESTTLRRWARSNTVSVRLARRAQIVLLAAEGLDNHQIADHLSIGRMQVGRWRQRFAE